MLTGEVLSDPPPSNHSKQVCVGRKRNVPSTNDDKHLPPNKLRCNSLGSDKQSIVNIPDHYRYNPVSPSWQCHVCLEHGLRFVCANKCTAGGLNVSLKRPTSVRRINGYGNCLFRTLCWVITGSEREDFKLHGLIIHHLRTKIGCWRHFNIDHVVISAFHYCVRRSLQLGEHDLLLDVPPLT